ncbi:helix-turn-helix domain-containing protein [Kordiimonas aestuarii]|uniref:helix-turn-helix domain-containing protein n=1 Tax=Kordiimonas aestuarii TaxID=1005925 RepID=UPI0021D0EDD3|nr:helix-turn-helix transcriptional regulator [Kordiimonas aestuarii]
MTPYTEAGKLLKDWRMARRLSQMELAFDANVSTRHLSCVETGKAQPGRTLLSRLSDALDIPLRERNTLLVAAGYAPGYSRIDLSDAEIAPVRTAIECILKQQEPYPAFVINRYWDALMVNEAAGRLFAALRGGGAKHGNILRQVFDPEDMRPHIANWEDVAGDLIRHLHSDIAASPADGQAQALLAEILAYPDVPDAWHKRQPDLAPLPLLTTHFHHPRGMLAFFSTITTFGTPRDITLAEIRIECLYPADNHTAEFCAGLAP